MKGPLGTAGSPPANNWHKPAVSGPGDRRDTSTRKAAVGVLCLFALRALMSALP
eukprot:CAMPEP_0179041574 /NCGR_PEP_ID=MMETSP0796-20121207/16227_1 /TAXON_ID=73915 /ORGANISM="Pyrodinium bahamense, Strain pbaha01" /LENGTH=53 /DNA_ID=CAMNT_0020737943 /DNA_START=114 /DNA_END=273 /DNA_ORIENTATION=-